MQQMATVNMVCAGSIVVIETHRTQPTRAGPCGVILSSIIVCVIRRILQVHLAARTAWRPGRLSMVWEFCKSCWTLGSPCNLGLAHRCAGRKKLIVRSPMTSARRQIRVVCWLHLLVPTLVLLSRPMISSESRRCRFLIWIRQCCASWQVLPLKHCCTSLCVHLRRNARRALP